MEAWCQKCQKISQVDVRDVIWVGQKQGEEYLCEICNEKLYKGASNKKEYQKEVDKEKRKQTKKQFYDFLWNFVGIPVLSIIGLIIGLYLAAITFGW